MKWFKFDIVFPIACGAVLVAGIVSLPFVAMQESRECKGLERVESGE